jgi:hypothetical protein
MAGTHCDSIPVYGDAHRRGLIAETAFRALCGRHDRRAAAYLDERVQDRYRSLNALLIAGFSGFE